MLMPEMLFSQKAPSIAERREEDLAIGLTRKGIKCTLERSSAIVTHLRF